MYLAAYDQAGESRALISDAVPSGCRLHWMEAPERQTSHTLWHQSQVLILATDRWPEPSIDLLIETFSPRHIVLLDQTPESHWYGMPSRNNLHLCEPGRLAETLATLVQVSALRPSSRLAMMSARPEFDSALLAISLAWQISRDTQHQGDVLILDIGQPESDIPSYLNQPAGIDFMSLVERSACIDKKWLAEQGVELAPRIHVIGMSDQEYPSAMTQASLQTVMDKLETIYSSIIVNLVGMPICPLLQLMAQRCDQHWLLTDQKNISLAQTRRLAEMLYQAGARPGGVNLILAPFLTQVLPGREMIAAQLELPIRGVLPCAHQLTTDINAGTLLPPTGRYKQFLREVDRLRTLKAEKSHWLDKLTGVIAREVNNE